MFLSVLRESALAATSPDGSGRRWEAREPVTHARRSVVMRLGLRQCGEGVGGVRGALVVILVI